MHDINYLNLFLILFMIYFNKQLVSVHKKKDSSIKKNLDVNL